MGAQIQYLEKEGHAPLKILGTKLKGGRIEIDGSISSQFISSILMIAPTLNEGIELKITGNIVSNPYILMTLKVMSEFQINWNWVDNTIIIKKQDYINAFDKKRIHSFILVHLSLYNFYKSKAL